MSNYIHDRILYFLQQHEPFELLSNNDLKKLVENIKVTYYNKNEIIFSKNQIPKDVFYVVFDGLVGIFDVEENAVCVDACEIGDFYWNQTFFWEGKLFVSSKMHPINHIISHSV